MRSSFTADTGQRLVRTPSWRRQAARRRMVLAAIAALAVGGLAWGYLATPRDDGVQVGPFSYLPSD